MDVNEKAIKMHEEWAGKIEAAMSKSLQTVTQMK